MLTKFYDDLLEAQKVEHLVQKQLSKLTKGYKFYDCSNQREYFHKGDIKAVAPDGRVTFIEVKADSRIAETHNLLCEETVYFHLKDEWRKGNFYSDYEIYCVVSEAEHTMYFMDFAKLREHYKSGKYKTIKHSEQTTYCYLCALDDVRSWGAMIAELSY